MDEDAVARSTLAGGLATPVARWACYFMLGSWCLLVLLKGELSFGHTGAIVAAAAGTAAAMIVTIQQPRRLTRLEAGLVVGLCVCGAGAALAASPEVTNLLLFNTISHVVLLLIPRGNVAPGLVGWALVIAYGLFWALPRDPGLLALAELLSIPLGALAGCLLWRYVVVEITRRQIAGRSAVAASQERSARTLAGVQASRNQLRGFRDVARPVLEDLVRGHPIDDDMRARLAQAEAEIRDRIRVPQMRHPLVTQRVGELRALGVTVVLLGEPDPELIGGDLAEALVRLLGDVVAGRVTIRCLPHGREARLSVVIAGGDDTRQVQFAADGSTLTRQ